MNYKVFFSFLIFCIFSLNSMQKKDFYIFNRNGNIEKKIVLQIDQKSDIQLRLKKKAEEEEYFNLSSSLFKKIISYLPFRKEEKNYNLFLKKNDKKFINVENLQIDKDIFVNDYKVISFMPIFNRELQNKNECFFGFIGLKLLNIKNNEEQKNLCIYSFSENKYNVFFSKEEGLHNQIVLMNKANEENYSNILNNQNFDNFDYLKLILNNFADYLGKFEIDKVYFDEKDKDIKSGVNFYFKNKQNPKIDEFNLNISEKEALFYFDSTEFNLKDRENFQKKEEFKVNYPLISKYFLNPFLIDVKKGFNEETKKETITYELKSSLNKKEIEEFERFLKDCGNKYKKELCENE